MHEPRIISLTITIKTHEHTRFDEGEDQIKAEIRAFVEKLLKFHTSGPVPAVIIQDSD